MSRQDSSKQTKDWSSDDDQEGSVSMIDETTSHNCKEPTTTMADSSSHGGGRNEIEEIRKQSRVETARVRTWRILVTVALLITAIAVTGTTYTLLVNQEDKNFRNVVSQSAHGR